MVRLIALVLAGAAAAMPATDSSGPSKVPHISNKVYDRQYHADPNEIMSVPQSKVKSYQTGGLRRASLYHNSTTEDSGLSKRDGTADGWKCGDHSTPIYTTGDQDNGGLGITIDNDSASWNGFYFYHNTCDNVPWKYTWIAPGGTVFISIPARWEGRVVRGIDSEMLNGVPQPLATWLEISWDANNVGWADVSLIRGCDGPCLVWDPSNGNSWKGFTQDILNGCPNGCYASKPDGNQVLMNTENGDGSINTAVQAWELNFPGPNAVYVDDHHGNPVISAPGGRFGTYWPDGRP